MIVGRGAGERQVLFQIQPRSCALRGKKIKDPHVRRRKIVPKIRFALRSALHLPRRGLFLRGQRNEKRGFENFNQFGKLDVFIGAADGLEPRSYPLHQMKGFQEVRQPQIAAIRCHLGKNFIGGKIRGAADGEELVVDEGV